MDTFMFIAFCVFVFLVGIRIKQRFNERKQGKINGFQQSDTQYDQMPPEVKAVHLRRKKRTRIFTIILLFVLGGLMIYMIPALVQDFTLIKDVEPRNLFLRCLIFIFTIYIFTIGYIKAFGKNHRKDREK